MATVSVKNLSKAYSDRKSAGPGAVKNVTFETGQQELFVLLGPPGCGKSTILRMIAGLENPSQGDISIGGKRVNDVSPRDRDVAMVFQGDALYPHLSVFDNLALGLLLRKYPQTEVKKRVAEAADILGLEPFLEIKPGALSHEARQRVAIGRAIVRQPKVLLFDEPLSFLDSTQRAQMRSEIRKLHQRLQGTLIYATCDPTEAIVIGDRVAAMNNGEVEQIDAPAVLYSEPANLFVAGLLGHPRMNFVSGRLKEEGEKIRFREIDGGTIDVVFALADRPAVREFSGREMILGIRPEDVEVARFSRKEGKALAAGFPAIADMVEPLGAETNLHLNTGAHTLICRSRDRFDLQDAGHRFQFEIKLGKAHFFDSVSSKRLA
jgi:multiple sugar transport system ATP-binding protein